MVVSLSNHTTMACFMTPHSVRKLQRNAHFANATKTRCGLINGWQRHPFRRGLIVMFRLVFRVNLLSRSRAKGISDMSNPTAESLDCHAKISSEQRWRTLG